MSRFTRSREKRHRTHPYCGVSRSQHHGGLIAPCSAAAQAMATPTGSMIQRQRAGHGASKSLDEVSIFILFK